MEGLMQDVVSLDEFDIILESPQTEATAGGVVLDPCHIENTDDGNTDVLVPDFSQSSKATIMRDGIEIQQNENYTATNRDTYLDNLQVTQPDLNIELAENGSECKHTKPGISTDNLASTMETGLEDLVLQSQEFSELFPANVEDDGTSVEFKSMRTATQHEKESSCNEDKASDVLSLDNILVRDKQDSDSDGEFDFELPVQRDMEERGSDVKVASATTISPTVTEVPLVVAAAPTTEATSALPTVVSVPIVTVGSNQKSTGSTYAKPVAVVQPSLQILNISNAVQSEPRNKHVLEAAQQEWDNVATVQAGYKDSSTVKGIEPTIVKTVKPMSSHELIEILKNTDFTTIRPTVRTSIERRGFSAFINFLFGPPKMNSNLWNDRDRIFCIAATQLNNDDSSHMRTLQTIYRCLTGSKFDCARIGSHWEEIGFQGMDPATDLRGTGILGLLNLLYFLKDPRKQNLVSDINRLSLHPTQNFPFCVMGINLSRIVLQALRENVLNKACNKVNDVFGIVNEFYAGLYLQLYLTWKKGKTISDSGFIIKELEEQAKKNPSDVLKGLTEYMERKKTIVVSEKITDPGADNFVNVCEDRHH